jgi:predicted RNA-binding Zn-ribbon protein involved in translation (DUF1610 family)
MPTLESETPWDRQAADVRAAIQMWRTAHPQATLKDIEQEVDRQLAAVRARLIAATATTGPEEAVPPRCPDCGAAMQWDGERTRRLTTSHNESIALTRRYARCPACGTGLFPPG